MGQGEKLRGLPLILVRAPFSKIRVRFPALIIGAVSRVLIVWFVVVIPIPLEGFFVLITPTFLLTLKVVVVVVVGVSFSTLVVRTAILVKFLSELVGDIHLFDSVINILS